MTYASGLMLSIWATATLLTLYATYLTLNHFSSCPPHLDAPFGLLPVSILKPLKGKDEGLERNLETFFRLDYPDYELLFSVADPEDPAFEVAKGLIESNPGVRARLIVGSVEIGTNPKVNNLAKTYAGAAHDWLLISDSNVRVERDYLKRIMAHVESNTGVVTSVVVGEAPEGLGARLESVYLNSFYARGMILAGVTGHPCVVGKSMLFRRSVAERFGGIRTLGLYLAEDYMTGQAMRRLGLRVVTATDPIRQHVGKYSFREFWQRHLRWGRIRKAQAPLAFFGEPFFGCIVSGILGMWGFSRSLGLSPALFICLHLLLWSTCDALIMRGMRVKLDFLTPVAWFSRELLAFPLWLHIVFGNTVNWRGSCYVVEPGGLLKSRSSQHA